MDTEDKQYKRTRCLTEDEDNFYYYYDKIDVQPCTFKCNRCGEKVLVIELNKDFIQRNNCRCKNKEKSARTAFKNFITEKKLEHKQFEQFEDALINMSLTGNSGNDEINLIQNIFECLSLNK